MVAQDYARTYRSNAVLTASPGQLVLMLYDGALRSLLLTREAFARPPEDFRRLEIINAQLIKAQNILGELQDTLNHEAGGELSRTMDRLYDYYLRRLTEANMRKQVEPVIEVERLLREVRDGWAEMLLKHSGSGSDGARGVA
ncbi:MAG: flagellar export chaperone FliS [Candidatus Didemnitutus sp.]|nr:flagellar export chaperone FliS [Candidatus Didemnitutus sp.]